MIETILRLNKNILGRISLIIISILILIGIFAPFIAPYDPVKINPPKRLEPPSFEHFFGTDNAGRDIFSRVIFGVRISLRIGVSIVMGAILLGTTIGAIAGYYGGVIEDILMRLTDSFMAFPYLILALAIASVLGPSLHNALLAIIVVWWPRYARLTRSEVLNVKAQPFVEAAIASGASNIRILFNHVIRNSYVPSLVQASLDFGTVIIVSATLSFIGLGAQPPMPEWGAMISTSRAWIREAWWFTLFPGLAIFITVGSFNMLGDALRDVLDPRLR